MGLNVPPPLRKAGNNITYFFEGVGGGGIKINKAHNFFIMFMTNKYVSFNSLTLSCLLLAVFMKFETISTINTVIQTKPFFLNHGHQNIKYR